MTTPPPSSPSQHSFQAPTGTRDFYPSDLARLRYVQKAWRDASIRHGFEEIDGPTFEHLELYTVKSGEGIVSELFSFTRHGGEKTYALRPEFTPTLARMYAAKANALPKPTKWFWMQNCFRAERPQRGRLREFSQWNIDMLGDDSPNADAEVIACCIASLASLGLGPGDVRVCLSNRDIVEGIAIQAGLRTEQRDAWFAYLDGERKRGAEQNNRFLVDHGIDFRTRDKFNEIIQSAKEAWQKGNFQAESIGISLDAIDRHRQLLQTLKESELLEWCVPLDLTVVRGLAYYTGTVFEVLAAGERAVAGGGRYDKLIELFGGPPTPAVGFGMGDVVLSLVLQDKGLLPKDAEIARALGQRPDVFVISSGAEPADAALIPAVARLRREGLHARRSYKTTKNIGKLLKDAASAGARFAAIIEQDGATATVKNLDTGEQTPAPIAVSAIGEHIRRARTAAQSEQHRSPSDL